MNIGPLKDRNLSKFRKQNLVPTSQKTNLVFLTNTNFLYSVGKEFLFVLIIVELIKTICV